MTHRRPYLQGAAEEYGQTAGSYARGDTSRWQTPGPTALALQAMCADLRPGRILELGVGTGRYFPFLSGQNYVGVDVFAPMIEHARARQSLLAERGFASVELVAADLHTYLDHSAGEPFDLIFSIGCIGYHVPVTPDLFLAMARRLRPGGSVFVQTTLRSARWSAYVAWKGIQALLTGRRVGRDFFVTTTPDELTTATRAAGLTPAWLREAAETGFPVPLLLALLRHPAGE